MINSPIFLEIEKALQNKLPFEIVDPNRIILLEKIDLLTKILKYDQTSVIMEERFKKNANWFSCTLRETPRNYLNHQRLVAAVRVFIKTSKMYENTLQFKNCSLELLALKLRIDLDILQKDVNQGFLDFAKEHHLHNSLMTHNHQLQIDLETDEIQILYQNKYIPWSSAKTIIQDFLTNNKTKASLNEPYALSLYGYEGIQNEDRYRWTKLKPLIKSETNKWADHFIKTPLIFDNENKGYIMEFCSSATESAPRKLAGDHSWIRLYRFNKLDEKIMGKMYSVGLYGPYKHSVLFDNFWMPFCIKKGYIIQEISEEWGINSKIKTIAKRISKNAYHNIKAKIQNDKNSDSVIFHLFEHNCDGYISDLAKLGSLKLPTKKHFLELFTCIHLKNDWDKKLITYPLPIRLTAKTVEKLIKTFIYLLTPFFNLFFYLIGSGLISKSVKLNSSIKPPLNTFSDFFAPKKLYPSSPWVLANHVKDDVENWRQNKMSKLQLETSEGLQKRDEIAFEFPKSYKIS